jgi:hypothetical protein
MKSMLRVEAAVLFLGWLSGLFFLFYSGGIFDGAHQWSTYDMMFIYYAFMLAVPFVLAAAFCWLLKRFAPLFVIGSIEMVIASCCAYYAAYFPQPQPDAGWMFLMVPGIQTFLVCVFSGFIFILGKFIKPPRVRAAR